MFIILIPDILILVFLMLVLLPFSLLGENLTGMVKILTAMMFLPTLESGIIAYIRCKQRKEAGEYVSGMLTKTFIIELLTAIATMAGTYLYLMNNTNMGKSDPGFFEGLVGAFSAVMSILIILWICCHYLSFLLGFDDKKLSPVKIALTNIVGSAIVFVGVMICSQL